MRAILASVVLTALAFFSACSSSPPAAGGPTAECPVCKHEGDLACLCVRIEADTPHCECAGQTYYFCSDECRADFEANPARFLPKK